MTIAFILLKISFLFSYNQIISPSITSSVSIIAKADTALQTNKLIIPKGLFLDSIKTIDSSKALTVGIVLPKSGNKQFLLADKLLQSIINKKKNSFINSVDKMLKEDKNLLQSATGSMFRVWPKVLYKDKNMISYLLIIDMYHAGDAHSKSDYYTFNYDLNKQKQIRFSDYFSIKSKADSKFLMGKINSVIGGNKLDKMYDLDFNINTKTIFFNFDDYEIAGYAEGMIRVPITKKELLYYIKPEYR